MFTTPASEYMSRTLISVSPDTRLDDIARILEQRDISSVPVLDSAGAPLGIVSMTDLLRDALRGEGAASHAAHSARSARDVMHAAVIGIDHRQPIRDAAQAMVTHGI